MSLPVLRSIVSPEALLPIVATAYGLNIERLQLIKALISDTYRVVTGDGQYILRIYPGRRRTLKEIEAELDFVQFVHGHGIPVSIPLKTLTAARTLTLAMPEAKHHAVLWTYAEGQPMGDDLGDANRFGETLAQLHLVADKIPCTAARTPLDLNFLLEQPLEQLRAYGQRALEWAYLDQLAEIIRSQVNKLPNSLPTIGFCHGDVCKANAHIDAAGAPTLFDFDFAGLGWRAYDVATFVSGETKPLVEASLAGYRSVRELTDAEVQTIPLFQVAQKIWLLGTRVDYINEWGELHFSPRFVSNVLAEIHDLVASSDLMGDHC